PATAFVSASPKAMPPTSVLWASHPALSANGGESPESAITSARSSPRPRVTAAGTGTPAAAMASRAAAYPVPHGVVGPGGSCPRSEEHTSELQSRFDLVCRLLLEKQKGTLRT